MPSIKCDNGKWKFGEKGECIYNSEQESDEANADYYENQEDMKNEKRHVKEIIEDAETITIVYGKSDEFEGIKIKEDDTPDEGAEETIDDEYEQKDIVDVNDEIIEEDIENDDNIAEYSRSSNDKSELWKNINTMEKRYYDIETRIDNENDKNTIIGHAAVFGKLSEDLGGFRETISPNAFDDVLENDTRAYFNHDPNFILGRVKSGTLRLKTTEKGLQYELDVPNTQAGRDLLVSMERGDVSQSSFAFTIADDSWQSTPDGEVRTINKVARLYDVSPVSLPAYPDANDLQVAQRGLINYKDKQKMKDELKFDFKNELRKLKISILKRK
jgi:HK97 family phage prohead protease